MSTSRRSFFPGISKKISSWVRPGVCEVRARLLRPVSALMREDLPTLERPAKATSSPAIGGSVSIEGEAQTNCQSRANSLRPASISFASMSVVMRSVPSNVRPWPSLRAKRSNPSSRQGTHGLLRRFAPRNDEEEALRFRLGLFPDERVLEIVEQLHLHAVAAHDEALLQHREQIVPGPVDHEASREAREH